MPTYDAIAEGSAPIVDEYLAIAGNGRVVGGPYKHHSDAKAIADQHGGWVQFVSRSAEAPAPCGCDEAPSAEDFATKQEAVIAAKGQCKPESAVFFSHGRWHVAHDPPVVASELAPPAAPPTPCLPYLRLTRDGPRYNACMAIAEKLGAIDTSKKAYEIFRSLAEAEDQEVFLLLALDTHLRLRGYSEISRGARDHVEIPTPDVLRYAIVEGAQAIVVAHTHPTGYTQPSEADAEATVALDKSCRTAGLLLMDHLVLGPRGYFSFVDSRRLKRPVRAR